MKKIVLLSTVLLLGLYSCKEKETLEINTQDQTVSDSLFIDEHNAQNSLDWDGTYEATLPCADCPGIKTVIVLDQDDTFKIISEYQERNTKIEDAGEIMWHDNGSVVHLKGKETDIKLKVIENGLIQLNQDGTEITSNLKEHYQYKKL